MSTYAPPSWPAHLYAQARPDYLPSVLSSIIDEAPTGHPLNVVDMGAGTGLCSKAIIEALRKSAQGGSSSKGKQRELASIISLDAASNMLEELSRILYQPGGLVPELQEKGELDQGIKTDTAVSTFEQFDMTSFGLQGQVDVITIAQAWHWCSDWERSVNNMAEALRPGGILVLLWNLEDREAATWVGKVRDLYEVHEAGSPQYRLNLWHAMYKTQSIKRFEAIEPKRHTRLIPTTVEGVCDRVKSKSYVSVEPKETQEKLIENIRAVFQSGSDEELQRKWIDKERGIFEYPYTTDVLIFRKKQ